MNETVWCYQLNESSLVERLLSAVFFFGGGGGISLKKSEMRSTLSILLYVNVGVAEIDSS